MQQNSKKTDAEDPLNDVCEHPISAKDFEDRQTDDYNHAMSEIARKREELILFESTWFFWTKIVSIGISFVVIFLGVFFVNVLISIDANSPWQLRALVVAISFSSLIVLFGMIFKLLSKDSKRALSDNVPDHVLVKALREFVRTISDRQS